LSSGIIHRILFCRDYFALENFSPLPGICGQNPSNAFFAPLGTHNGRIFSVVRTPGTEFHPEACNTARKRQRRKFPLCTVAGERISPLQPLVGLNLAAANLEGRVFPPNEDSMRHENVFQLLEGTFSTSFSEAW